MNIRDLELSIQNSLRLTENLLNVELPMLSEEGYDKNLLIVITDSDIVSDSNESTPIIVLQISCSQNRLTVTVPWHKDFPISYKDYVLKIVMEEHDLVSITISENTWESLLNENPKTLLELMKTKKIVVNGDGVWLVQHFDYLINLLGKKWNEDN